MNQIQRCTYVTRGWGVHDERWTDALRSCDFSLDTLSIERDGLSLIDIRSKLADSTDPVLAGPLDLTRGLLGISAPLFGLSWGFDLVQAERRGEDLAWIHGLNGLIVDSQHTREIAESTGMATSRIYIIPWGVDLKTFTPEGSRADLTQFGVSPASRIILSLRALEPLYRVEDIVTGFANLVAKNMDAHLVIGNDGGLRPRLQRIVQSLSLEHRVSFIGHQPEDSLPELLRAADAYVTASEVDGSSVTLLQAMACGTPIVASDIAGNIQWITPGATGLLFRLADSADLAAALGRLLDGNGSETANKLGSRARAMVAERADWAQNIKQLTQILTTVP